MQTEKPTREDPAIEVGAQLALDEASDRCAVFARSGKKALEAFSYDLVEHGSFRLVALVLDGVGSHRDRGVGVSLLDWEDGGSSRASELPATRAAATWRKVHSESVFDPK